MSLTSIDINKGTITEYGYDGKKTVTKIGEPKKPERKAKGKRKGLA